MFCGDAQSDELVVSVDGGGGFVVWNIASNHTRVHSINLSSNQTKQRLANLTLVEPVPGSCDTVLAAADKLILILNINSKFIYSQLMKSCRINSVPKLLSDKFTTIR